MDEPPKVNSAGGEDSPEPPVQPQAWTDETLSGMESDNPFAPVAEAESIIQNAGLPRVELPPTFWAVLAASLTAAGFLCWSVPPIGVPVLSSLILGAIRTPFWQRHFTWQNPGKELPNSVASLAMSTVFMFVNGVTSFVAFCIVCIPGGLITVTATQGGTGGNEGFFMTIVFGVSGLLALAVLVGCFLLTLRLPI